MYGGKIIHGKFTYTVGLTWRNKFITLINDLIINKGRKRTSKSSGPSSKSKSGNHHSHPKGNLYQILKDTVAQRKEQLAKMPKNDPNRTSMENELGNAERKLKEMKDKYQFEHLTSFNLFENVESPVIIYKVNFGITSDQLDEILYEITDEFTNLDYFIDSSLISACISKDDNSFIIDFYDKNSDNMYDSPPLYYLEPKIFDLISNVNDKLGMYGLEVFYSDFGETDCFYELVITKKGNKPKMNPDRFSTDEKGDFQYK